MPISSNPNVSTYPHALVHEPELANKEPMMSIENSPIKDIPIDPILLEIDARSQRERAEIDQAWTMSQSPQKFPARQLPVAPERVAIEKLTQSGLPAVRENYDAGRLVYIPGGPILPGMRLPSYSTRNGATGAGQAKRQRPQKLPDHGIPIDPVLLAYDEAQSQRESPDDEQMAIAYEAGLAGDVEMSFSSPRKIALPGIGKPRSAVQMDASPKGRYPGVGVSFFPPERGHTGVGQMQPYTENVVPGAGEMTFAPEDRYGNAGQMAFESERGLPYAGRWSVSPERRLQHHRDMTPFSENGFRDGSQEMRSAPEIDPRLDASQMRYSFDSILPAARNLKTFTSGAGPVGSSSLRYSVENGVSGTGHKTILPPPRKLSFASRMTPYSERGTPGPGQSTLASRRPKSRAESRAGSSAPPNRKAPRKGAPAGQLYCNRHKKSLPISAFSVKTRMDGTEDVHHRECDACRARRKANELKNEQRKAEKDAEGGGDVDMESGEMFLVDDGGWS